MLEASTDPNALTSIVYNEPRLELAWTLDLLDCVLIAGDGTRSEITDAAVKTIHATGADSLAWRLVKKRMENLETLCQRK